MEEAATINNTAKTALMICNLKLLIFEFINMLGQHETS
jgi:hypothetical protein